MIRAAAITASLPLIGVALLAVAVQGIIAVRTDPEVVAAADNYMRADCAVFLRDIQAAHDQHVHAA